MSDATSPPDSDDLSADAAAGDKVDWIMGQWARERPDLDVSPQGVIGRLHRVAAELTAELATVFAEHGLDAGEFDVLATLRRSGPPYALSPGELIEQTMVTSGAVSKRLDRCEQQGWVTRTVDEHDRRGRRAFLTAAGRRLIDRAFTAHMANEQRLVGSLSREDRALLEDVLRRWGKALGVP